MHPITEYFSSNSSDPCNIASCTMKALDWRVSTVQFSEPFPPQSFTPPSPGVSTLACTFGFLLFDCRAIPQWPTWCGTKFMLWGTACQGKDPKVFKITYNHTIHLSSDAKLRLQPLTQFPVHECMCFHMWKAGYYLFCHSSEEKWKNVP